MRNTTTLFFSVLIFALAFQACGPKEEPLFIPDGTWENLLEPPFTARKGMVSFVIEDRAYVGLGYDKNGNNKRDFYV